MYLYIYHFCGKIEAENKILIKEEFALDKDDSKKNKLEENLNDDSANLQTGTDEKENIILPRKRNIVKNTQLSIVFGVFLAAFITAITWSLFFNQSVIGKWYYINNGEYTETFDSPTGTSDEPEIITQEYTQRVCYEFKENGECVVTLGTMSVVGQYNLYSADESKMLTAAVAYQYTPLLYGSYTYEIKGNALTGKKLIISASGSEEELVLEEGEGENPLEKFRDFKGDDRLTGTWRDDDIGIEYKFTSDGYFTRSSDDGLIIEHTYTIIDDGVIMAKYFGDDEQNYSYNYSFDADNNLIINDTVLKKI